VVELGAHPALGWQLDQENPLRNSAFEKALSWSQRPEGLIRGAPRTGEKHALTRLYGGAARAARARPGPIIALRDGASRGIGWFGDTPPSLKHQKPWNGNLAMNEPGSQKPAPRTPAPRDYDSVRRAIAVISSTGARSRPSNRWARCGAGVTIPTSCNHLFQPLGRADAKRP